MTTDGRIEVMADISRNCLKLSFIGLITVTEMQRYEGEIERALSSISPGFSLLTDLTNLSSMEMNCASALSRTMERMKSKGVKLVIRVIPDPSKDVGMSILSLFHYPHGLKIVTTESREGAARVLNQPG